jgi:protein TonB
MIEAALAAAAMAGWKFPAEPTERPATLVVAPSRLWGGAVVAALVLHAGVAAAFLSWPAAAPPPAPPSGAMMVELAPLAAPPAPPSAEPPSEQRAITQPPEPERTVLPAPKPPLVRKVAASLPAQAPPKPVAAERPEHVVEHDAAPPSTPAPPAPTVTAPAPGIASVAAGHAVPSWQGSLRAHLERHKRYPGVAQFRRQQGVSTIRFVIDRTGRVLTARLERASGHTSLDEESLALLDRAQPLPLPPDEIPGERIELVVPVQFFLR